MTKDDRLVDIDDNIHFLNDLVSHVWGQVNGEACVGCRCTPCDSGDDADSDGLNDCTDECPTDPLKTEPGVCGCGIEDVVNGEDCTARRGVGTEIDEISHHFAHGGGHDFIRSAPSPDDSHAVLPGATLGCPP